MLHQLEATYAKFEGQGQRSKTSSTYYVRAELNTARC